MTGVADIAGRLNVEEQWRETLDAKRTPGARRLGIYIGANPGL